MVINIKYRVNEYWTNIMALYTTDLVLLEFNGPQPN